MTKILTFRVKLSVNAINNDIVSFLVVIMTSGLYIDMNRRDDKKPSRITCIKYVDQRKNDIKVMKKQIIRFVFE